MNAEVKARPVIKMIPVISSQIEAIGHDPETNTLAIQFPSKDSTKPGNLYHYENFTAEHFEAFINAESIGSHFIKQIKPKADLFPYQKIS
jgi:hypothetical protein